MGPASYRQIISRRWFEDPADPAIYIGSASDWISEGLPSTAPSAPVGLSIRGPRLLAPAALSASDWIVPASYYVSVRWADVYGQYPVS